MCSAADIALMEYLRDNIREDQVLFIASQDEASYSYVSLHVLPISATVTIFLIFCRILTATEQCVYFEF